MVLIVTVRPRLYAACLAGHVGVISVLLDYGADVNDGVLHEVSKGVTTFNDGSTLFTSAFDAACIAGNLAVATLL